MENINIHPKSIEKTEQVNFDRIYDIIKLHWINTPWEVKNIINWLYKYWIDVENIELIKQNKRKENLQILDWISYITKTEIDQIKKLTNMILDI